MEYSLGMSNKTVLRDVSFSWWWLSHLLSLGTWHALVWYRFTTFCLLWEGGGSSKTLTNSWYMATHFTRLFFKRWLQSRCSSHVLCEIFLCVVVYTWLVTKENKWRIEQYGGNWKSNWRNVCWVKMLSRAVMKYDVLQKKMGRDCSINFWRQWVARPCILLLLNSNLIYFVLSTVLYLTCTVFWLYTILAIHAMSGTKQLCKTQLWCTGFGPWFFGVM